MEVEEKARSMGWVPEDDFRGDPDRWVDAETFVKRGEEVLPIVKERLDNALEKITAMQGEFESKMTRMQDALNNITSYSEKVAETSYKKAAQEYEHKLATLKNQMKKAVKEGDEDTYTELEAELETLAPPEKPEEKVQTQELPAWFDGWKKENTWFGADREVTRVAASYDNDGEWEPHLTGRERADAVTAKIKELYPQKFENPNRQKPGAVDSGGGDDRKTGKKTFNDLPKWAKDAYEQLKEDFEFSNKKFTKDQYLAQFDWEAE